jgi:hypothetical protein
LGGEEIVSEDATYNIAASEDIVGPIYPILQAEDGEILDGNHRLLADPNWPRQVIHTTSDKKKLLIRVHANDQRRDVPKEEKEQWVANARKLLQKDGAKGTQVEIAKFLGFTTMWVSKYDKEPIQKQNHHVEEKVKHRLTSVPAPTINIPTSKEQLMQAIREPPPLTPLQKMAAEMVPMAAKAIEMNMEAEKTVRNSPAAKKIQLQGLQAHIEDLINSDVLVCPKGHAGELVWSCCGLSWRDSIK